jgi:uncharacterized membrane protein
MPNPFFFSQVICQIFFVMVLVLESLNAFPFFPRSHIMRFFLGITSNVFQTTSCNFYLELFFFFISNRIIIKSVRRPRNKERIQKKTPN